jgi:hypothetical protein
MATEQLSRMIYLGGYSGRKGLLGVLAFPESFPKETEFTMFYTTVDEQWWQLQFDFDIVSLTYLSLPREKYRAWWLVGKRGEVVEYTGSEPRVNRIPTAGTGPRNRYGYLSQIRTIDNELFICGYRRQVYRRNGNTWDLISREILDSKAKGPWSGFESIDGFSANDLYTVGDKGEIWHYDGKAWIQCDSPTNQNLADVRCFDGKVWACGDGGIVLRGDVNQWETIWHDGDPSENWWGLESFQGRVYLAGNDFLGVLEAGEVVKVNVGIKQAITTRTLHQKDGLLWSIGERNILVYDGKKWVELVVPENR